MILARSPGTLRAAFLALALSLLIAGGGLLVFTTAARARAAGAPVSARDASATLDCLAVGDSLTWDMFAMDLGGGYFPRLAAWLAAGGMPASDRLALPGGKVADAAAQAGQLREMPARLVVIELGSNDAPDPAYAPATPVQEFERDYRSVVAAVLTANPDARIMLVGLWGQDDLRPTYDGIIRRIAADTGASFVELGELADDPDLRGPAGRLTPLGVSDDYHPNDEGHGAIAQRLREAIAPLYGLDATPPHTRADRPAGWQARAVTVRLRATPGAAPVTTTRSRIDGGPWYAGTVLRIHGDGVHILRFNSVDARGDTEPLRRCVVHIDGVPPRTQAIGTTRVATGRQARFGISLVDPAAPTCLVRLEVLRAGRVILRRRVGNLATGAGSVPWKCILPPGRYRYRFTAVDPAGNPQSEALAATLIVS